MRRLLTGGGDSPPADRMRISIITAVYQRAATVGEPISIYGEGLQTRSFCYVDDLVEGFIRLMDTGDDVTGSVNLGNPGEFTILELAQKVIAMTGSSSQIDYHEMPQDDPKQRQPDITKARQLLGWESGIQLDEGLGMTIDYFRKLLPELTDA